MLNDLVSLMTLAQWGGCCTLFSGFYNPLPADELADATFGMLVHYIANADGPVIGANKDILPFFVPCLLKVAPLTQAMMGRTGLMEAKQRSSAHVTTAAYLVLDVDGLEQVEFDGLLDALRKAGLTFLAYSTHSNGREDKPGVRARLVIPVDRPLDAAEYKLAWLGFDQIFLDGEIAAKDDSGKAMWQQQGIHVVHPERAHHAFRVVHKAGVANAEALIAEGSKIVPKKVVQPDYVARQLSPREHVARLSDAIRWIDSEKTSIWVTAMTALKASAETIGTDDACELAVRYSERASAKAKANNDDPRYDPATFFENVQPTMPAEAAIGTLCGLARDGAVAAVNADRGRSQWSVSGRAAAIYLARFHSRLFSELTGETA